MPTQALHAKTVTVLSTRSTSLKPWNLTHPGSVLRRRPRLARAAVRGFPVFLQTLSGSPFPGIVVLCRLYHAPCSGRRPFRRIEGSCSGSVLVPEALRLAPTGLLTGSHPSPLLTKEPLMESLQAIPRDAGRNPSTPLVVLIVPGRRSPHRKTPRPGPETLHPCTTAFHPIAQPPSPLKNQPLGATGTSPVCPGIFPLTGADPAIKNTACPRSSEDRARDS